MMNRGWRYWFWLLLGPASAVLVMATCDLQPGKPAMTRMAGVALWMALWWITEAVPLAVTALLPLAAMPLLGIMAMKDLAPVYLDQITFLFIGGFIVALAMERWGMHQRFALQAVTVFGGRPAGLLLGFLVAAGFMSMWMSNTAATMVMMPPVIAVLAKLEETYERERLAPLAVALLLAIAYGSSIGGIATPIGTPTNLVFVRQFHLGFPAAPALSFLGWMRLATPLAAVMLLLTWGILWFLYLRRCDVQGVDRSVFREELRKLGPATYEQKVLLVVAELMIFMWIFRADIDLGRFKILGWTSLKFLNEKMIADSTVAMIAALLLFVIPSKKEPGRGIITWAEAERLPWGIVMLFGGGFALAAGFTKTGLDRWCGDHLASLGVTNPFILVMVISFALVCITEFTANTSTVEMVLPVLVGVSVALHANPLLLLLPATICASLGFMLPAGTAPNAMVFATGRLSVWQMVRTGFLLNMSGAVLTTVAVLTWGRWAFGFDLLSLPAWAAR